MTYDSMIFFIMYYKEQLHRLVLLKKLNHNYKIIK